LRLPLGNPNDVAEHENLNPEPVKRTRTREENLNFFGSTAVENGRGCAKLVEPAGLVVSRTYEISWKKQTYDIAELARLRFEEGLGSRKIATRLGIPRTTAIHAVHRLEKQRGHR
jgi:hypothetical protein